MSEALDRYIEEDRRSRGRLPPEDKGFFGGIKKGFLNASVGALGGIGKTVETFSSEDSTDAYGNKFGSGLRKWAEETLHSNQQWRPAENGGWGEYAGNAIGNAIGSTAVLAPAVAADAMLGTRGAATFALCFGQTFGDNLQRNRELYGVENESKNLGLAAAESAVDSFIEVALGTVPMLGKTLKGLSYAGKREIVRNMFREAEKDLGKSGAKKFFLGMAKNGAEEGAEEGLQYVNSWMWRALGGDQSNEFKLDELADNMAQGAIGGAALGIIGGADSARNARRALETEKTEQQTNPPETPVAVTTRFGEIPLGADGKPLQPVDADSQALLDKHLENPPQQEELSESGIPKRIIDTSAQLTRMIADDLGIKLRYFDEEGVDPHVGKDYVQNGWFDKETNELWIDRRGTGRNPLQNMGHEFKHYLNKTTPELAQKFDALFQSGMTQEGRNELEKIGELYRNDKQRNPDANAAEEFSADTFAQFWTEPDFWRNVAEKAESQERGMGEKLLAALQDFIKMVRKKLKQIGTPEAKALFDNMGELRNEAVRIVAEVRRRNGQSSEAENVVGVNGKNTVQSVPVRDLNLDPQRFQFKSKADKVTGVDESNKIGGTWDPKSAGNLYIWEDKNGKKFIVNGHHRFDLARKNNVENVNAIIDREADGVTAEQARRNGVLINIRDEQGDVRDYAEFVRRENMDENTAEKEGILSRAKGRQGYTIGRYAGNTLYSAYRNRDISDQAAALIADIARGDEAIEAVGIREKNLKPEELRQLLKALNEMERPKTTQGDLFGFDDSALEVEKTLSKLAAKHIREIRETVNAARDAIKNPEAARKLGVKVGKDAERLLNNALKEQAEWDKWYLAGSGKREILMKEAGISNRTDTPELKKKELTPPEKRTADDSMSDENTDSPLHRKDSRTSAKDAGTRKTTQEDNIYLRMPMDRVRNDAELGVKLAQDALKILEKQNPVSYSKPKAEKENTNDSNTSGNLEHRGNVGNSENTNHETALLNERGGNRRIPQSGIPETAESGLQRNGSGNLPGVPTANTRTGNREENHRGIPGNRTGAADDSGRKRSSDDSGTGTPLGTDGRRTEHNPARSEKTDRFAGRTSGTVKLRDRTNIAETLPYLFPEQQDDVFKAETRFEKNKGMLFTNATGTGKTFTGLGIIKRFVMQGKNNVLIVTPTDQKNKDWRNDAQKLDLDVKILSNTRDNGKNGIVVTTYANFQQNPELANRNWDLLVFDESHKISQSESGRNTQAANKLHYLSGAHGNAWERSIQENGVAIRDALAKIDPKYATYELKYDPEYTRNHPGKSHPPVLSKYDVDSHFKELPETLKNLLKKREEELSKSKVLFLSATPFAYHRSLLYADGYLFDIPKKDASGYNSANGEEEFFIRNFGYRMRYNKLTRPEASVDQGVMERAFFEKLRKSGAVSGRLLTVDKDYSREFFKVDSELGEKIQKGMNILQNYKDYPLISRQLSRFYTYNYITSLLEGLKAKAAVEEIEKNIALGRKVVVFHNRNTGTPIHPFHLNNSYLFKGIEDAKSLDEEIDRFEQEHPELVNLKLDDLKNPIEYFKEKFGDRALFFDGTLSKTARNRNVELFNRADSGKDIIIVQTDAGKEGISLHDTTGEKPRVFLNLGLPTKPTDLIQSEGRIFRLGVKSNAIFRYPVTGLPMERYAFGSKINERAGTAENLGMGDAARNLRESLKEGYSNADYLEPGQNQGTGGKEADRNFDVMDDFSKAKTYYFGRGKKSAKNKAAEGTDYYATPEPLGLKMVEWADLRPNEDVLEPSAGHGAIARFFPDYVNSKAIEPSVILNSELAVNSSAQVLRERFEDHHIVNKYDGIVMNPPFGTGGKTAIEHLEKAFQHLRGLGRIVAILPEGGMAEKRLEAFLENTRGAHLTADIGLPNCTFQRAGTSVKTHIVVIDKAEYPYQENMMPEERGRIEISADTINEFFNKIKDLDIPSRRKETGKQYSLQRVPKNIADFRAMPAHPIPKKAKFSTVKELYEIYKKEYLGKVIRTASGHDITFKPGHFFRLIAGTPAEGRKGFIAKAKNAADAIAQIEDGKIGFGDIAGYQKMRGEYLGAFKDVIPDADFWIREKENKFLFGKKYSDIKKADGFLAVTLEIEKEGKLGPVSFHPRKFSEGLFSGKEVHWNIANPLDHAKAPGDVSSRDKSSGLNDIIAPENKMSNGKLYSLSFPQQKNPIRENGNEKIRYQNQLDNRTYHTKSNEQLNKEAVERIANYGGIKNTIQMMMEGDLNFKSDVAQRVLQTVLNSDEFKALNNNEKEQIADVYIKTGTELGRALASRRLALLDMNDIHSMQAHVNALVAKLQKEKNLREIRNTIQKEFGIDIDNLPDSLVNNPQEFDRLLRRLASMKASKGDKLYEFWINSILSGPVTHTANILGNTANAVYELGVKRFTEALLNSVLHKKDAATFGEFREMTKAFNWKNAWEKAKTAFDLEVVTPDGKLESFRAAIGGNTGRIIRTPGRLLRAADEFAKAIIVPAEAAAHAYREGKAMNLPEADLKKYVSEQLKNLNSPSMEYGYQRALDLTFQEEPGVAIQTLMHWRDAGGIFGNVLKFTLPFLKTPGNILRQGIRKSPLGILNLAYQTGKAALGKRKIDNEYIQHAAEQILAWGTIAMIAGMDDDNDDGMPFLTGSSPAYGSAEQRFKANKVPPYSIRIGGTYYSYKRIEPLATGLAFIADGLDAYRKAKSGKEGTDVLKQMIRGVKQMIVEKSFLDSLGEINRIASDPERSGMTFLSNFASSWMPNVVRQTVGLFDDNVKDYKSRERGAEFFQDQFRVTTDRMFPWKAAPKIDYFGREIKKDSLEEAGPLGFLARLIPLQPISPDSSMNRAERLMWEYNQRHPENEFWPSVPAYYFSRDGKKGYFTGNDYQEFARESGQLALKQINNAFRHGLLNDKNPTEQDIKLIRKIFSRARKEIREKMIRKGSFKME